MRAIVIAALLGVGLPACGRIEPNDPAADRRSAREKLAAAREVKRACASAVAYERLKAFAFDEAVKVRRNASPRLAAVRSAATVRMEGPVARSRDERLDVTVCEGRLILDLPPGLQDAFDGDRRLQADVEYAAQPAADGSGLVYRMRGAEPIIYRLAALDLRDGAVAAPVEVAAATPPAPQTVPSPEPSASPVATSPAPVAAVVRPEPKAVRRAPSPTPPPRPAAKRAVPPPPRPTPRPVRTEPPSPARVAPRKRAEPPREVRRPLAVARPAFNCRVARGRVERMICSDARLAAQDRRMSSTFRAALAESDGETREALRGSRDHWLAFRNSCPTAACVSQAYEDRVAEIEDIAGY